MLFFCRNDSPSLSLATFNGSCILNSVFNDRTIPISDRSARSMYNPVLRESPDPPPIRRPRSSVWESPVHRDDSDSPAGLVFVSRNFTMCPEQIGVAPLSRSLASRTLVMPRSCLVNNCLIFPPARPPSLAPSRPPLALLRAHSLVHLALFRDPGGLGVYERLKNRSNCARVASDKRNARFAEGSGGNYCRNRRCAMTRVMTPAGVFRLLSDPSEIPRRTILLRGDVLIV